MQDSTKNSIVTAIVSVLIIGISVGASTLNSTDDMRIVYEASAPFSYDAETESVDAPTAEAAVYYEHTEEAADIIYVYVSSSGKYHARADCSGMKRYDKMTLGQAVQNGHTPCLRCYAAASEESVSESVTPAVSVETAEAIDTSICETASPQTNDTSESIVYVSSSGKYHTRSDCSGMKRFTEMSLDEAISSGYDACRKCAQ